MNNFNKKIAIVGAGPSGLTCGYYLANKGYIVDIFEAAPQAGGWLRYGIPEYRLPKNILDKEIELMCLSGIKIHTQKSLGIDFYLPEISKEYDAVYLAIGASKAIDMPMKITSSDGSARFISESSKNTLKGIYLGVEFLKNVSQGNIPPIGSKVAVIGGGNTALDCARTVLRLGREVTIIYRRSRDEMPAEEYEIKAADEEGVKFLLLTNPVEYIGNDYIEQIVVEIMALGEPDSSSRRKPIGTGKFQTYNFDTVIAAISQIPEIEIFSKEENRINFSRQESLEHDNNLSFTKWSTIVSDENTMYTNIANIFAGGDFRRGPSTAIEAIADGRIAAENIDKYLSGIDIKKSDFLFNSKKADSLKNVTKFIYDDYEKISRFISKEISLEKRKTSFSEIESSYIEKIAINEAQRCLKCSCTVNMDCKLRGHASDYKINPNKYTAEKNIYKKDDLHPKIKRDKNKCVKCGLCVNVCREVQMLNVFDYSKRSFKMSISTAYDKSLIDTNCNACGECVDICPTGALIKSEDSA